MEEKEWKAIAFRVASALNQDVPEQTIMEYFDALKGLQVGIMVRAIPELRRGTASPFFPSIAMFEDVYFRVKRADEIAEQNRHEKDIYKAMIDSGKGTQDIYVWTAKSFISRIYTSSTWISLVVDDRTTPYEELLDFARELRLGMSKDQLDFKQAKELVEEKALEIEAATYKKRGIVGQDRTKDDKALF